MAEELERKLIEIIATDRIDKPISSMSGKLKRRKPKLAKEINLDDDVFYKGDRVWARVGYEDKTKARGMRDGIREFSQKYPRYGTILNGIIEEKRLYRETHLYFGMQEGCRITSEDYLGVMQDLGFTNATAKKLYPELMEISRNLARKRQEKERSILIG